jgi:hypothetical protein
VSTTSSANLVVEKDEYDPSVYTASLAIDDNTKALVSANVTLGDDLVDQIDDLVHSVLRHASMYGWITKETSSNLYASFGDYAAHRGSLIKDPGTVAEFNVVTDSIETPVEIIIEGYDCGNCDDLGVCIAYLTIDGEEIIHFSAKIRDGHDGYNVKEQVLNVVHSVVYHAQESNIITHEVSQELYTSFMGAYESDPLFS